MSKQPSGAIEHIIFDLSEVLLTGVKDTGIALREKHQLEISGPKMDWAQEKHPLLTPLVKEFFHGTVTEDEYVRDVIERYPQIGHAEWLKQHIRENFVEVEGTRDIVIELRKLGYKLSILSNHAKEWIDHCEEKFNFHELFDVRVYSYDIGASKPDPRTYKAVLTQLKTIPDKCLFIDDSDINIAAAHALGFSTILFTSAADLEGRLKELLPDFI
ncbi:HAD family phosphatase [Candidatus Kaiserbacteria bacterium]|nr:HAD family phosphatase [Candidatus Kaiserbacteria bacterium]